MAKQIIYANEGLARLSSVARTVVKAVGTTLGPKGKNVLIQSTYGAPKVTKDGVTVAKAIKLPDNLDDMLAQAMIQPAIAVADVTGDGTTTTTVLLGSLIEESVKYVASGMDPMGIARGMNKAVATLSDELAKLAKPCKDLDSIKQVAYIASNNNQEIGNHVGDASHRVGPQGVIKAQAGDGRETILSVVEGMQLDRGYAHAGFVGRDSQTIILDNVRILLVDKKISNHREIEDILIKVMQVNQPLLVIAEEVEGDALAVLIINNLKGAVKNCAVKAPGFGDNRKEQLRDIAVLTKAEVISEELGLTLSKATLDQLGFAKRVIIDKDTCTIIDGAGDKSDIEARIRLITEQKQKAGAYEAEKYEERAAKLSGGVALIKVGGSTETEIEEKQARVQDALSAVRAAVEEGIVPGGGIALLRVAKALEHSKGENADENAGIAIVRKAVRAPLYQIVENAGAEAPVVAHQVLHGDKNQNSNYGYNAATDQYGDMIDMGIIDPKKVTRVALEKAVSIASMLITSSCMIADLPKQDDAAGNPGGGMGGMGGMDMM